MRFYYFAIIIVGIIVLLNAGGIATPVTSNVINALGVNLEQGNESLGNAESSRLFHNYDSNNPVNLGIWQIMALIAGAGVIIGLFGRTPDINYALGFIIIFFTGLLLRDWLYIGGLLMHYETWIRWVALAVFSSLTVGYFISVIQFWRGEA